MAVATGLISFCGNCGERGEFSNVEKTEVVFLLFIGFGLEISPQLPQLPHAVLHCLVP